MFYDVELTVPPNTSAAAPLKYVLQLVPGTIHQVDVQFPAGCVGLVRTAAYRGAHQVWPSNPDGSFRSNGQTLSWTEDYDLDAAPFGLTLVAWNLDDFYSHTLTWRFALRSFPAGPEKARLDALYEMIVNGADGAA